MGQEILDLLVSTFWMILGIAGIFAIYLAISAGCWFVHSLFTRNRAGTGYGSLKTVTFGDESSVVANRIASIAAVVAVFVLWGVATGSNLLPFTLPQPFTGDTQFEYTAVNPAGDTDTGMVFVRVHAFGEEGVEKPEGKDGGDGFAKDDIVVVAERRSKVLRVQNNDEGGKEDGFRVTHVNGQPISSDSPVTYSDATVEMTGKGSLFIKPDTGWTMEALYLPPPEQVWKRFWQLNAEGYQNVGLWENVFWSLIRVVVGFGLGCLFGIPLGFAMGLNSWMRGWFDPIVEFMRPVPPLALIPLVIIWFGIGEQGKISLLFLAALWIMTIAARAGVSGVNISKVHAAYSLGATKRQILSKVILPNSLPEIFTGARVAMGVCWGTVVAAELVAAEKGAGKMIIAASKFQLTDIVIVGIILIGIIGYMIDIMMRQAENFLVPWKGRG
ncbi:Taurine transport system permease protein TauC [Candidatus Rhodobacter oscarellae]|uniref:Taurine transport system permease protein TauC n=1 Tax=Candidatus Rhodobacter oscarellae TaxID=1675527 RepID=A0A0J9EF06_9RHOB|nr:ABC transporter permease subunit [Candidatus Rhodobacter lobularis]KMW60264.1 Taurine transport system permease protein TauC [Candidatus Rhodobacter lobularis]